MQLRIISPDENLFEGKVKQITIPSQDGYLTILPNHIDMLAVLKKWDMSFLPYVIEKTALDAFADHNTYVSISWWMCKVVNNTITVVLSSVE